MNKKTLTALCLASLMLTAKMAQAQEEQAPSCETAYAFGSKTFSDIGFTRWGWEIVLQGNEFVSTKVYAGAGQTDILKGTYVGDLEVTRDNDLVTFQLQMLDGFSVSETHIYVGTSDLSKSAPGQYANLTEGKINSFGNGLFKVELNDTVTEGAKLYVVVHAVVCTGGGDPNNGGDDPNAECDPADSPWKGIWDSAVEYKADDVVEYEGSSYVNVCCDPQTAGTAPPDDLFNSVTNEGCWKLVAEKGDTGATGETGPTGEQGEVGPEGPQGPIGPAGPQGLKGDKGDKGDTGDQGEVGPEGPTGAQGPQGEVGPIGPQGLKGDKGDKGDTGDQGEVGPEGPTGAQGPQGEVGPIGPQGPEGPTGAQGPQGEVGPIGPQGLKGDKGDKGDTGDQGEV
ncbi:hypothetical protein GCAAIG_05880 [Candidatus Electronema halotolerans]